MRRFRIIEFCICQVSILTFQLVLNAELLGGMELKQGLKARSR